MRLRNSIKMVFATFGLTYKVLLYKVIVFTVLVILGWFIVLPNFNNIINECHIKGLIYSGGDVIKSIFTTSDTLTPEIARSAFSENLSYFNSYISGNLSEVYIVILVVALLVIVSCFFNNIADFAVGEVVNDHMSSLTNRGFVVSIFKNLGKSSIYSLIHILIGFIFLCLETCLCILIYLFGFNYIGLFSLTLDIIIFCGLNAIKQTFLSDFMPLIIDGNGIKVAFKKSIIIKNKQFGRVYSSYLFLNFAIMILNLGVCLFTLFAGAIISFPLSIIIIVSFQFVNYYTLNSKKYYISYDEIIKPASESDGLDLIKNIND